MKLTKDDKDFLALYSDSKYEKPSVTVDAVIFKLKNEDSQNYRKLPTKKLQVFLTKRQYPPYKDTYSVVGSFIDLNFELGESMQKSVEAKTGLKDFYFEQLFTFGDMQRDPRTRVLSVSYMALVENPNDMKNGNFFDIDFEELGIEKIKKGNSYQEIKKVKLNLTNEEAVLSNIALIKYIKDGKRICKTIEIIESDLAFDHAKLIVCALERLKNKLEYTDIIFNLFPKLFTLTELKQGYEVILGKKLLDANFRRKTSKYVLATDSYTSGDGHRNSRLFEHNALWDSDFN